MFRHALAMLPIIALSACARVGFDTGDPIEGEYPQELWACDHIESPYSAYVEAQSWVAKDWSEVEFVLYNKEDFYSLPMRYVGDGLWTVEANLLEIDCNSDDLGGDFVYYE